jgi:hypothetical protein
LRKATLKSKPKKAAVKKKAVKKTTVKKSTVKKPVVKKKTLKKKTVKKDTKLKTSTKKNIPVPFQNTDDIPHHLMRTLIDIYYDFQGQRIQTQLRIGASERERSLTKEEQSIYGITTILENAHSFEKDAEKLITKQLKNHALYTQYLSKIVGIGPMIAAGLIAYVDDIEKFQHVSSLWQYSGYGANRFCPECKKPTSVEVKYSTGTIAKKLHPFNECPECHAETISILQRRMSGYQSNWNDKLKTLAWKAGTSFVKQSAAKSKYRKLYDQIKKKERMIHPVKKVIKGKTFYNDGHIHNRAMRKVVKIFLAHVWQTWRRQEGLEATEPYAKQLLGHSVVEAFVDK